MTAYEREVIQPRRAIPNVNPRCWWKPCVPPRFYASLVFVRSVYVDCNGIFNGDVIVRRR